MFCVAIAVEVLFGFRAMRATARLDRVDGAEEFNGVLLSGAFFVLVGDLSEGFHRFDYLPRTQSIRQMGSSKAPLISEGF